MHTSQPGRASSFAARVHVLAERAWARLCLLTLLATLGLAGCGTLPPAPPRVPSAALAPELASPLYRIAVASTPSDEQSGVRLLPHGGYSLEARLQLARRATQSLDVQYYVLENDGAGRLLMAALREAAARGVRVRLLVDDLYTSRSDALLRGLAAFANVDVRVFNPFCCARGGGTVARFAASLWDFDRVNRRMHNKLFIADGAMAIAGGRNIADEYFLRHQSQNFVDMDAFVMGSVVRDLAGIFDRYWNSEVVWPIGALGARQRDPAAARDAFDTAIATGPPAPPLDLPPVDVLGYGPIGEELEEGRIGLIWGRARAFADPPEKVLSKTRELAFETSVANDVMMNVWRASEELVITSPYLIPGALGMQSFESLRRANVNVILVTNSLAATDEPLVHNGYAKYRGRLLAAGVDLYELSPTRTQKTLRLGVFGSSTGRLHAKTAVVDRKSVFIGSMNLDPRSANSNTELGMLIESPALAKELLRVVSISRLEGAYRVRLRPGTRQIEWITMDGEREVTLGSEPESSWWLRLHNMLLGWFVPEQLL